MTTFPERLSGSTRRNSKHSMVNVDTSEFSMRSVFILTALFVIAACQSAAQNALTNERSQPEYNTAKPSSLPVNLTYTIGADDILHIDVWKEPELSGTVIVRPDGNISLPLVNDIRAAGLTPMDLVHELTASLNKFIAQPQVTVVVTATNSRRVYVLGEVTRAGAVPLQSNMTVLQALSSAGGFSEFANLKGIYVLREHDGSPTKYPFNYKDVIKGKHAEQNIRLQPGDTVVVP